MYTGHIIRTTNLYSLEFVITKDETQSVLHRRTEKFMQTTNKFKDNFIFMFIRSYLAVSD